MRDLRLKAAVALGGTPFLRGLLEGGHYRGVPIFMFHRVIPEGTPCYDPEMATSTNLFETFLEWISEKYRVVTVEEVAKARHIQTDSARPLCALTFDDGWKDNFDYAFPLLRMRQVPATIFLPVRFIGTKRRFWQEKLWLCLEELGKRGNLGTIVGSVVEGFPWCRRLDPEELSLKRLRSFLLSRSSVEAESFADQLVRAVGQVAALEERTFLNWDEVRAMQNDGIAFGSHTLNHTLLTCCAPATVESEIQKSRHEIAERLGAPPAGFSFPWGASDSRLERQVHEAGYEFAVTTCERLLRNRVEPYSLPRLPVSNPILGGSHRRFSESRVKFYLASKVLKSAVRDRSPLGRNSQAPARLRIAFVIDTIDSWEDGGTERQIAKFIAALAPQHFEAELYFLRPSQHLIPSELPCTVFVVGEKGPESGSRMRTLLELSKLFRRRRPHIVQTFFRDGTYYGVTAGKMAHVPIIIISRRNSGHWKSLADRVAVKVINRMADAWQCNSRTVAESLKYQERVPDGRIDVLPNGIDLESFSPPSVEERARTRKQLGLPDIAPVFVSVATLFPIKDPLTLVEAAALVCHKLPAATFSLVGEGPMRHSLEERIKELELDRRVQLAGAQSEVRKFLAAADIGVLTSRSEGSSNALLEYMAMGLPVVVSDIPANQELVSGCFFQPGNSADLANRILHLWDSPVIRAKMSQEHLRRAKEFSEENFALRAQAFYARLAAQHLEMGRQY